MRSLLFVPADSASKLAGADCGADVVLIDLEDAVALSGKAQARQMAAAFLAQAQRPSLRSKLYVRINGLATGLADADLDAVMAARPDGIMLPKSGSRRDVQHLSAKLAVREAEYGLIDGSTKIIAIATGTAASIFQLGSYAGCSHRLAALAWAEQDLSADLGAQATRDAGGLLTAPLQLARSLTLFGAAAAGLPAIDTAFTDFGDAAGLRAECDVAARDGFTGKLAIHPDQVAVINAAFTPSEAALARARRVLGLE